MLFLSACEQALCLGKGWKNRKEREGKGCRSLSSRFFHPFLKQSACSQAPFMSLRHSFLSMGIFWIDTVREMMKRIFYLHISSTGNTRSLWWTERLLGFRRPLTFIKGSRQYHSPSIKLFLENLTKTMYFPLLAFSLVNNITNYLSTLTWSSNNDYG